MTSTQTPDQQQDEIQRKSFVNKSEHKHMLVQAISLLLAKLQTRAGHQSNASGTGNFQILTIDSAALLYIEKLVLDFFNALLLAKPYFVQKSPEKEFAEAMTNTSAAPLKLSHDPILDIIEADLRVKQLVPNSLAITLCERAKALVATFEDKAQKSGSMSKKILQKLTQHNFFYPSFSSSTSASHLNQFDLTFPLERIHDILSKLFERKLDMSVVVYLVRMPLFNPFFI